MGRARYSYRRALELDQSHAGAWMNLGRVDAADHRWESAERCLRAAIALDPASVRARFFLAEMELAKGDRAAAGQAIVEALKLQPKQQDLLDFQKKLEGAP